MVKQILEWLFWYNGIFDNRMMEHCAGGYMVSHISSLFFKKYYWIICFFVAIIKETMDHWIFGCGGNEIKHLIDIISWTVGGLSYYIIVLAKRKKYGYN